jgi:hypothetical protein
MAETKVKERWTQVSWLRWRRSDGAVVRWDDRSPHPNPINPTAKMWTAWEPEPSSAYLVMRRGRLRRAQDGKLYKPGFARRWRTAEAAMKAVDKEFPYEGV